MAQDKIIRFTLTERLIHWSHALPFVVLLLTGLAMHWTPFAHLAFGSKETAKIIHEITALIWVMIPALWVLTAGRSCMKANLKEIFQLNKRDLIWLWAATKGVFKKETELPSQGRFNVGQKINSFLTLAFTQIFGISGFLMWVNQGRGWILPALIHNVLFISVWPIFIGHLYLALAKRSTRESIKGMIWGKVDSQWAQKHHLLWYQEIADEACPGLFFYGKNSLELGELVRFTRREGFYSDKGRRGVKLLLKHSNFIVAARTNGRIIGLGRGISDGISYGIITEAYVKQGLTNPAIKRKITERLTNQLKSLSVPIIYLGQIHEGDAETTCKSGYREPKGLPEELITRMENNDTE